MTHKINSVPIKTLGFKNRKLETSNQVNLEYRYKLNELNRISEIMGYNKGNLFTRLGHIGHVIDYDLKNASKFINSSEAEKKFIKHDKQKEREENPKNISAATRSEYLKVSNFKAIRHKDFNKEELPLFIKSPYYKNSGGRFRSWDLGKFKPLNLETIETMKNFRNSNKNKPDVNIKQFSPLKQNFFNEEKKSFKIIHKFPKPINKKQTIINQVTSSNIDNYHFNIQATSSGKTINFLRLATVLMDNEHVEDKNQKKIYSWNDSSHKQIPINKKNKFNSENYDKLTKFNLGESKSLETITNKEEDDFLKIRKDEVKLSKRLKSDDKFKSYNSKQFLKEDIIHTLHSEHFYTEKYTANNFFNKYHTKTNFINIHTNLKQSNTHSNSKEVDKSLEKMNKIRIRQYRNEKIKIFYKELEYNIKKLEAIDSQIKTLLNKACNICDDFEKKLRK